SSAYGTSTQTSIGLPRAATAHHVGARPAGLGWARLGSAGLGWARLGSAGLGPEQPSVGRGGHVVVHAHGDGGVVVVVAAAVALVRGLREHRPRARPERQQHLLL